MSFDSEEYMRNLRYRGAWSLARRILEWESFGPNMPGRDPARQLASLIEQVAWECSHQDRESIVRDAGDGTQEAGGG